MCYSKEYAERHGLTSFQRRCLKNTAATKAATQYAEVKLKGVTKEQIHDTLLELSKEGRKLDAVDKREALAFLDKEMFKVTHDPQLSPQERRQIMKNLQKAKSQISEETTIAGSRMHAWKNLFDRLVEKMRRPFAAILGAGMSLALLSGCVGGPSPVNTPEPYDPSVDNPGGIACSTLTEDQIAALGDGAPTEIVTDEYGDYCKLEINPKSKFLNPDDSVYDLASLEQYGFTKEEAQEAVKITADYAFNVLFDSEGLDNSYVTTDKWYNENKSMYSVGLQQWVASAEGGMPHYMTITGGGLNSEIIGGVTARNGESRIEAIDLEITRVYGASKPENTNGFDWQDRIVVEFNYNVKYKAEDETVINTIMKLNNITEDALLANYPGLADASGINTIRTTGQIGLYHSKDKTDKLIIEGNYWDAKLYAEGPGLEEVNIGNSK